ncbi:MAG: Mur ligase family protein [Methanosphaera stadtmanae]|nr:Mur ligase family protein [Methanosphaera stadtmanae]
MQNETDIKASQLAKKVDGILYGPDRKLCGNYTFLNKASDNDIVIRHWINEKGIEIAKDKNVSCVITQQPQGDTIKVAEDLHISLIVTNHIEYATAYALNVSINKYATDAFKVAVTGTNGKSTTTHLLYTIFSDLKFNTYTNTDAESEGNTLIDPRVSSELSDFYNTKGNIEAITLEVSEVQGWDDRLMKNHSYQMISAIDTDAVVITNASLDHINLVDSFDQLIDEISGAARAIKNNDKQSLLVLNYDDENIRKMSEIVEDNSNVNVMYFGNYDENNLLDISHKPNVGIYVKDTLYVEEKDLPFTSKHFIQDIMAALAVCIFKQLNKTNVINSLNNYKPLARRFIKLRENPVIIDDFAHNPSGIQLTIENGSKLGNHLLVVDAIRGSRGVGINKEIAEALVLSLKDKDDYTLVLTKSMDVVNNLNTVLPSEEEVFTNVLNYNNIKYTIMDTLEEALISTINKSTENDVILLLGAQGMDPASEILSQHNLIE